MYFKHPENFSPNAMGAESGSASRPYFSIGLTTYNRRDLLTQALNSIRAQTFADYEVLIGNDYPGEILSGEMFGIEDCRFRFINHPKNLREVENMNFLLHEARGHYFTWLSDDDYCMPNFLQSVYEALLKFDRPQCVLTSYSVIAGLTPPQSLINVGPSKLMTGREFLRRYLGGNLKTMGANGIFEIESLRRIGGIEHLSNAPIGLYGEYMLLIRAGLLVKVAYVDAPLVAYRAHGQAWGISNIDLDFYRIAGENLIRNSVDVLTRPELRNDFLWNFKGILQMTISYFLLKLTRSFQLKRVTELIQFMIAICRQILFLRNVGFCGKGFVCLGMALFTIGKRMINWSAKILIAKIKKQPFPSPPGPF